MKKGIIFFIIILLIGTFFFANIEGNEKTSLKGYVASEKGVMIQDSVIEKTAQGEQVRVYIKLKSEMKEGRAIASQNIKDEVLEALEGKVKHVFDDRISAFVDEGDLLELQNNPNIESIGIIGIRSIFLQDSVPKINSSTLLWNTQVNGVNLTGEGQTICVIDTGINYNHSDFGNCYGNNDPNSDCKVLGGWDFCANDDALCTGEDDDPLDVQGHGTHCAGIAAANGDIKGVAPGAKLIIIKAGNATGSFWDDDLKKAIDWCVSNASKFNITVISMSLGGGFSTGYCPSDPLASNINNAVANNISVVIASGNNGWDDKIAEPACVESAMAIGGTTKADGMYSSGNRWNLRILLAPGANISSTSISGAYIAYSGTSMATPHVAGAIAIINQYRELEEKNVLTPSEIETALNSSGKTISADSRTYSRIDVYNTILELDETLPVISLNSPAHNTLSANENQTFNCSASDLQLKNLTFYLWNSSKELINQTPYEADSNNFEIEVNQTLENGTYYWNCLGYDNQENSAWGENNYTLKVGEMGAVLYSPLDDSYTKVNLATFNCSVQSTLAELANVTLLLWNSSGILVYNESENITGTTNNTIFSYNLGLEGTYEWNCLAYDESSNEIIADSNYTLTFDITSPVVSLVSPSNGASQTSTSVSFKFNVTDANDIANCSLILDDVINSTSTSVTKSTTQTITKTLSVGTYDWRIKCYDDAGNYGQSSEREIEVETATTTTPATASDSTTTTPTTTTPTETEETTTPTETSTQTITKEEFKDGYNKKLAVNEKIKFSKDNETHTLEIEEANESIVKIKIQSDPITLLIEVNQTKKADLNGDKTYDIAVTYHGYEGGFANITIKEINEKIGMREIFGEEGVPFYQKIFNFVSSIAGKVKDFFVNSGKTMKIIFGVVGGILLLAVGFLIGCWIHRKRKKTNASENKKESKKPEKIKNPKEKKQKAS